MLSEVVEALRALKSPADTAIALAAGAAGYFADGMWDVLPGAPFEPSACAILAGAAAIALKRTMDAINDRRRRTEDCSILQHEADRRADLMEKMGSHEEAYRLRVSARLYRDDPQKLEDLLSLEQPRPAIRGGFGATLMHRRSRNLDV